ncbi:MAG: serine hydrolase [Methylacidiphilales bacterium]|nr:serine hydrolase [Candidatus Methylacidiphilales bacterium]
MIRVLGCAALLGMLSMPAPAWSEVTPKIKPVTAAKKHVPPVPDLPPQALKAADTYSIRHRGLALLVIQNNRILLEDYQEGSGQDVKHRIYSGTKGFWTLAGLAATEDGLLHLNEPVADTLPQWYVDPRKAPLCLCELLNFTSGLEPDFPLHGIDGSNRDTRAMRDKILAPRGQAFIYGPAAMQVFHEVLKHRLADWNETPTEYLERRVLYPLGLGPQRYLPDSDNNPLIASGFMITAREWAAMGRCLLHRGWPILANNSLTPALRGSSVNPAYSLGFWNNHAVTAPDANEVDIEEMLELDWYRQNWSHAVLSLAAPPDLFASIGSAGQRLYVVPSRNLVVVRLSRDSHFKDSEFLQCLFGNPQSLQ